MPDVDDSPSDFPDMKPVRSAPPLVTINGCGMSMYGARDADPQTGTYVKTHCLCLLFMPIVALSAYRVADSERGWYFIGRVPLSAFARAWNCFLVLALLGSVGYGAWHNHTSSPGYAAGKRLAEADRLVAEGKMGPAAPIYFDLTFGGTEHAVAAVEKFQALIDGPVAQADAEAATAVFRTAQRMQQRGRTLPRVLDSGLAWVTQHAEADPRAALEVLEIIAPFGQAEALNPRRRELLERLVVSEPGNADLASQLGVVYEAQGELAKCEPLLAPHQRQLGVREGARILGQIYAHQSKFEPAHALLLPYVEGRLKQLRAAEAAYAAAVKQVQKQAVDQLQTGLAPGFAYDRYQKASKGDKETLVDEYVTGKIKSDPAVKKALEAISSEARVVPVAIDLGIVILRRAQDGADPNVRREELEKAEKMFLAVRGLAGESDQYRLYLGQVYYWLGKHDAGRKLFDELLASKKRSFETLVGVARLLREVGALAEARALAEEAYDNAAQQDQKHGAAAFRSTMWIDTDDQIAWLRRSNTAEPSIKGSLSTALGDKAIQDGNDAEAAQHLREAIDVYSKQAETAASLNNGALAHLSLFRVTGDRQALDKGLEMLDRAVALDPSNSILLSNVAGSVMGAAFRDVIGKSIDLKALRLEGRLDLLAFLYKDAASREQVVKRLRGHAGFARASSYLDRLLTLAPKSPDNYHVLAANYRFLRDEAALRALRQRAEAADLDLSDIRRHALDQYTGKEDAKLHKELGPRIERYEAVLKERRKAKDTTFAVAACSLIQLRMTLDTMGVPLDADALVKLAEEAHAAAPSKATGSTLVAALLARAGRTLEGKEPAYAGLVAKARRALSPSYLIAVGLDQEGKLGEAIRADQDVRRAVALHRQQIAGFPDDASEWSWAVMRALHPDDAARTRELLAQDKCLEHERALEERIDLYSATVAYRAYWSQVLAGDQAKGQKILKECAERGVPIPLLKD